MDSTASLEKQTDRPASAGSQKDVPYTNQTQERVMFDTGNGNTTDIPPSAADQSGEKAPSSAGEQNDRPASASSVSDERPLSASSLGKQASRPPSVNSQKSEILAVTEEEKDRSPSASSQKQEEPLSTDIQESRCLSLV